MISNNEYMIYNNDTIMDSEELSYHNNMDNIVSLIENSKRKNSKKNEMESIIESIQFESHSNSNSNIQK